MGAFLFIVFVVVPILELAVIIQVGQVLGVVETILALIAVSLIGAVLVKREGLRAWYRVNEAVRAGRVPAQEVVDGALVLLGGALMLTPGFLTDALGLVLVVPITRAVVNRAVRGRARTMFRLVPLGRQPHRGSAGRRTGGSGGRDGGGDVVDVDVVGVERTERERGEELDENDEEGGSMDGGR